MNYGSGSNPLRVFVASFCIGLIVFVLSVSASDDMKPNPSIVEAKPTSKSVSFRITAVQPQCDLYAPILLEYCLGNRSDAAIEFPVTGMSELIGMTAHISRAGAKGATGDLSLELDRKIRHKSTIQLLPGEQLKGAFLLLFDSFTYDFLIKEAGNYSIFLDGTIAGQEVTSNKLEISIRDSHREDIEQMLMEYTRIITECYSRSYPDKSLPELNSRERQQVCYWLNKLIDSSIRIVLNDESPADEVSHEQMKKQFEALVEKWPSSPYAPFVALCLAEYYSDRLPQKCGLSGSDDLDALQKCERFQKACKYFAKAQQEGTWRCMYAIGREAGLRSWALHRGGDSSRFDELYNALLSNQDHFLSRESLQRIERSVHRGRFETLPDSLKPLLKKDNEKPQ